MNFPDNPSGGDLFNGFIYNATLGVWDVATSDGYFAVTNNASSAYVFNGFGTDSDSNPTLYLHRGKTYEFAVNATGHPFYIKTVSGTGTGNAYSDGVTNNGTASGTIKFVVPQDAPSKLYYNCSAHAAMAGEIIIPRAAQIDDLSDVDTSTTAPTDGQVLTWDNANSKWEPATASGGIALTDISVTTNTAGTAALTYTNNTGVFTYTPPDLSGYLTSISGQSIEDLSDVNTMAPTDGQVLTWDNANSRWDAASPSGGSYNDASVDTHLNTSTAATNEVLSWNGTDYDWVAQSGGGGGASVTTADTAPSSPSDGDLWYDTTTLRLYVYYNDGTSSQWVKANPSGSRDSNTSVAIQETAPSNPSSGDMWFDPNALKTYIYYNDGDSDQWVQANPTGGGGSGSGGASVTVSDTAPSSPSSGDLWWHSTDLKLYVYYTDGSSNQWVQTNPSGTVSLGVDDLTDVDTTTAAPSTGDLLQWNGTNWVPYTHTNGITEIDQWRLTADLTSDADPLSSNLSRVDDASFSKVGTGMSVSNGVWSFPSTGLWKVSVNVSFYFTVVDLAIRVIIQVSSDGGSNWDNTAQMKAGTASDDNFAHGAGECFVNCTSTSDIKLRFSFTSISSGNQVIGEPDTSDTYFSFMRLGDSQ